MGGDEKGPRDLADIIFAVLPSLFAGVTLMGMAYGLAFAGFDRAGLCVGAFAVLVVVSLAGSKMTGG